MDKSGVPNLLTRALSGALLAICAVGAIYHSYWGFGVLLLAITLGALREFYRMYQENNGFKPQLFAGYAAATAIVAFGFDYFYNNNAYTIPLILFLLILIPLIFVAELCRGKASRPLENIGSTLLGIVYISLPMAMLAGVPLLMSKGVWNPWIMIFYLFVVWSNDSFAYLVGVNIGRHKLNEEISPKKSWEGFFGGVAGSILMSCAAAYFTSGSYLVWIGLAIVLSVMGCVGDLVESMFKRSCEVKDSGGALPGHGGLLDRFDSFIFSAPFALVYLILMNSH
ncbi:MAG: phosphatidate cytidylyltransferase [Rikenellaceae bacterium]